MQYPESLQVYKLIMFSLMKSKRCTKQKYAISRDALTIINEQFSVQLPDDEDWFYSIRIILNNYENSVDYESGTDY